MAENRKPNDDSTFNATATSYSKKVLENLDKVLTYMEVSREDLFTVNKKLLEAFKALNNRLKVSETENAQLNKCLLDSKATINALQQDVLDLRQALKQKDEEWRLMTKQEKMMPDPKADSDNSSVDSVVEETVNEDSETTVEEEEVDKQKELMKQDDKTDGRQVENERISTSDLSSCDEEEDIKTNDDVAKVDTAKEDVIVDEEDGEEEEEPTIDEITTEDVNENVVAIASPSSTANTNFPVAVITPKPETISPSTTPDDPSVAVVVTPQKPEVVSYSTLDDSSNRTSFSSDPRGNEQKPRPHQFEEVTRIRFNTCQLCKSIINPMSKYYVCLGCKIKVDKGCFEGARVNSMEIPCISMNALNLVDLVAVGTPAKESQKKPQVPAIIVECCNQIEQRATTLLSHVGATPPPSPRFGVVSKSTPKKYLQLECLYNVNDEKGRKEVDKLFDLFFSTRKVADLKLHQVHPTIISGLLVRLLQSIAVPLVHSKWWTDCLRASDPKLAAYQRRQMLTRLLMVKIEQPAHRHTLAFLLLHLKRVMLKLSGPGSTNNSKTSNGQRVLNKQEVISIFAPLIAPSFTCLQTDADKLPGNETGGKMAQMKIAGLKRQILAAMLDLPSESLQDVLKSGGEFTDKKPSRRTTNFGNTLMSEAQRKSFSKHMSSIF